MYIDFFAPKKLDFLFDPYDDGAFLPKPIADKHTLRLKSISVHNSVLDFTRHLYLEYELDGHIGSGSIMIPENTVMQYESVADSLASSVRKTIEDFLGCNGLGFLQDRIESYVMEVFASAGVVKKFQQEAIEQKAYRLPGIRQNVRYPCNCSASKYDGALFHVIIHLNDNCGWSRERIADWIDGLHDEGIINAEFEPWEEMENI